MMNYLNKKLITKFKRQFFIGTCIFCNFAPDMTGESMKEWHCKKNGFWKQSWIVDSNLGVSSSTREGNSGARGQCLS